VLRLVVIFLNPKSPSVAYEEQVYIWQRVWTDSLKKEITEKRQGFERSVVLAAKFDYDHTDQAWNVEWFDAPLQYALKNDGVEVSIRISSKVAKTQWSGEVLEGFLKELNRLPEGLSVLQIDYDCPSEKLQDYQRVLRVLRESRMASQLEITCLPDWLNFESFGPLVKEVDQYVMQVHGLFGYGEGVELCDVSKARRVAVSCAGYNKPFSIALPTYRHALVLNRQGGIEEVVSEGAILNSQRRYQIRRADEESLSDLVKEWKQKRPEYMKGVAWFRLPLSVDRMNWTDRTFDLVRQGNYVDAQVSVHIEDKGEGLYVIWLKNLSGHRKEWPKRIELNWSKGVAISVEGGLDYDRSTPVRLGDRYCCFEWRAASVFSIEPSQELKVGWVLMDAPQDIKALVVE